jgi:hypothetical protein
MKKEKNKKEVIEIRNEKRGERMEKLRLISPMDLLERFRRLNLILGERRVLTKKIDEDLLEELWEIEYILKQILSEKYSVISSPFQIHLKDKKL